MKQARTPKWSVVVMRGADKKVKQFHVSKRSVFAAPTVAILAVTGCFAGLLVKSTYDLHQVEGQLSKQNAYLTETVFSKDEAIRSLQQEVLDLSGQAEQLNTKVNELQELELKLKQFIDKYGKAITPSSYVDSNDSMNSSKNNRVAAAFANSSSFSSPNDQKSITAIAKQTNLNLRSLNAMVDSMGQSMQQTLHLANEKRKNVDGYPSGWPTRSKQMTSGFGYRSDPFTRQITFHAGIDIVGKLGDPVFSAADGTVSETGFQSALGHFIVIDHLGGLQSAYMHLKTIAVREGDSILRGEKIGSVGSSGRSTGPHLHFQILQMNEAVNPIPFLAQET